ncbi:hypothetical protein VKS41_000332 [Umbelopsis sp. WA50703]
MLLLRTVVLLVLPILATAAPIFVDSGRSEVEPASYLIFESLCEYYENVSDEVLEAATLEMLYEDGLFDALKQDIGPVDEHCWTATARPLLQSTLRVHFSINHANLLSHIRPLVSEILPTLLPLDQQQLDEDWLPGDRTAEALVPALYNLNQVMGFRLGTFMKTESLLNDLNERSALACRINDPFMVPIQKNLHVPSRNLVRSRAYLSSGFESIKQQLWTQYDEQIDDVIRVVMEDFMDDE